MLDETNLICLVKAKSKQTKEWVTGYYVFLEDKSYIVPFGKGLDGILEIDDKTLCRFVAVMPNKELLFEYDITFQEESGISQIVRRKPNLNNIQEEINKGFFMQGFKIVGNEKNEED